MEAKMRLRYLFPMISTLVIFLSACSTSRTPQDVALDVKADALMEEESMMEEDPAAETMDDDHSDELASGEAMMEAEMMAPDWFTVPLVDVNTGTSFTIEELEGKVILVETMAVWCSNCLRQQREVKTLHATLGDREDFQSIALDIDPNENEAILRGFASQNAFNWIYAVAPAEVASELGRLYGQQFLNPPSTPILLIDQHGEVHPLPFGIKSAAELQQDVVNLLDGEM